MTKIKIEETISQGRLYYRIIINGEYIGYGFSETDAREFGEKYAEDL